MNETENEDRLKGFQKKWFAQFIQLVVWFSREKDSENGICERGKCSREPGH